jgi:DNA replication protein DnaC
MTKARTTSAGGGEDNLLESLLAMLRGLRLRAMAEELSGLLEEAARGEWGRLELVAELFRREEARKCQRRFTRHLKESRLSECYTLENFDLRLAADHGVEPSVVRDLAQCEFVRARRNLILAGGVGTGKTYLARTLGVEALKRGFRVLSFNTAELLDMLYVKRESFHFGKAYARVRDAELLILDDLAYMPYAPEKVEFLFSLIVDRHELGRGSTIVTSNTDVTEWWQYFPSKAMGMAFSDRLLDGAQGIRFSGESIRQSRSRRREPPQKPLRGEPARAEDDAPPRA